MRFPVFLLVPSRKSPLAILSAAILLLTITRRRIRSSNDSLISDQQTIAGVYVAGSVSGRIIAGGAIANVEVVGTVERVATGTAAVVDSADPAVFYTYDFGGGTGLGDAQLTAFTLGAKKAGASISNVKVGTLFDDAALE